LGQADPITLVDPRGHPSATGDGAQEVPFAREQVEDEAPPLKPNEYMRVVSTQSFVFTKGTKALR
jgi:hypothetical protein